MSQNFNLCGIAQGENIPPPNSSDSNKIEAVTTCVGFDDILDVSLGLNHGQVDHYIVVTSHDDYATQKCVKKHGATLVVTDLFNKNGRKFNKGAAINVGFDHFQFNGWRLHLDSDAILPDNFNRILFNHTNLDMSCLYGADRIDVIGKKELLDVRNEFLKLPQNCWSSGVIPGHHRPGGARVVDNLRGYCPIGCFQLWNFSTHRSYPHSLGTAAHDDIMFAQSWPESKRRLLPSIFCYHLIPNASYFGENWNGRRSTRLK